MNQPNAFPFTIKKITKTTEKFAAICYIYEGPQFLNLCRVPNPDGTYNISEKCLAQLSHHNPYFSETSLPDAQYSASNESSGSSSLAPYRGQDKAVALYEQGQSPMPPFPTLLMHYWPYVLLMILAIFVSFGLILFLWNSFRNRNNRSRNQGAHEDDEGNLVIGKIKYDPKVEIGRGRQGTFVFKGFFEDSQVCAVKRIVAKTITLADREIKFLRELQHENLVRYLATENDTGFVYIAIELAECTLRTLVQSGKIEEYGISKREICRQAAKGLEHLHEQNIIHRDIKPENILVSLPKPPENKRLIMISDFGLSKQLTNQDMCHSTNVMRYFDGTQGWMPPEIILAKEQDKNLSPDKSADIFSLGCVFYYVIFDGKHPFGDLDKNVCQENIKSGNVLIDYFSGLSKNKETKKTDTELQYMSIDLVSAMISHEASKRPPISTILKYPMFWSSKQALEFLSEVSDRIETKKYPDLVRCVENSKRNVIGFSWKGCLGEALLEDINGPKARRTYQEKRIGDLLRIIRNKHNHLDTCEPDLQLELGHTPDEFYSYFGSRFPHLLVHTYKAAQDLKTDVKFMEYYDQKGDFLFPLPEMETRDQENCYGKRKESKKFARNGLNDCQDIKTTEPELEAS